MAKLTREQVIRGIETCRLITINGETFLIDSCEVEIDDLDGGEYFYITDEVKSVTFAEYVANVIEQDVTFKTVTEVDPETLK